MDLPVFSIITHRVFDSSKQKLRTSDKTQLVRYYEFEFYTEDCDGGHWLDGIYYPVKKGTCFLAKPGQLIRTRFPYHCCMLDISTKDPELCAVFDGLPNHFSIVNYQRIVNYIHVMVALDNSQSIVGRLQIQSYASRIIARLVQYCRPAQFEQKGTLLHQHNLLMVDQYMRDHISEDLNVSVLAKMCNLDTTYFHKLYTSAFGSTPAKRLLKYRINAAKRALLAGKLPLDELASQCGFSSQSYFCYRFKQITGMTPLQYRESQLSKEQNAP